jgi:hypothetical protein
MNLSNNIFIVNKFACLRHSLQAKIKKAFLDLHKKLCKSKMRTISFKI